MGGRPIGRRLLNTFHRRDFFSLSPSDYVKDNEAKQLMGGTMQRLPGGDNPESTLQIIVTKPYDVRHDGHLNSNQV